MLSYDLADLLSLRIETSEINWIANKIYELVALKEGLFPDSEARFIWHQLTDLSDHIPKLGPITGWWALPGEREIGSLKR